MEQVAHFRVGGKEKERNKKLEDLFLSKDCLCWRCLTSPHFLKVTLHSNSTMTESKPLISGLPGHFRSNNSSSVRGSVDTGMLRNKRKICKTYISERRGEKGGPRGRAKGLQQDKHNNVSQLGGRLRLLGNKYLVDRTETQSWSVLKEGIRSVSKCTRWHFQSNTAEPTDQLSHCCDKTR